MILRLLAAFGPAFVRLQLPIRVEEGEDAPSVPETDSASLARPVTEFLRDNPGPDDLLLVVEVSDTTLRFDRTAKAALYARAGIADY